MNQYTCSLIVMPLSLSKSMLSRNCSFISRFSTVPVIWSSLSAKVDFPWSICAMMQKFLILDTGTCNFKTKTKKSKSLTLPWEDDLVRLGRRHQGRWRRTGKELAEKKEKSLCCWWREKVEAKRNFYYYYDLLFFFFFFFLRN